MGDGLAWRIRRLSDTIGYLKLKTHKIFAVPPWNPYCLYVRTMPIFKHIWFHQWCRRRHLPLLALCLPSEGGTSSTTQQRHPSYSFVHPELELCSQNTAKQDQLDEKVGVFFRCFFCAFFSCWFGILHVPKHFWKQDLGLVKEIGQVAYTETNYQSRGCDSAQIFSHPIGWWRRARGHGKSLKLREVDRLSTDAKAMVMKPSRHWSNISYCRFTRLRWLHHHSPST